MGGKRSWLRAIRGTFADHGWQTILTTRDTGDVCRPWVANEPDHARYEGRANLAARLGTLRDLLPDERCRVSSDAQQSANRAPLESANRAPLQATIAADTISRTGNLMTAVAVPWFVLVTTGSPAKTGVAAFAGALPVGISLFFGGVIVDRFSFRRVSVVGDLASGLSVGMIPLLFALDRLSFPVLLDRLLRGPTRPAHRRLPVTAEWSDRNPGALGDSLSAGTAGPLRHSRLLGPGRAGG